MENQGKNKQFCYGSNSSNNMMIPKPNNSAERKSSVKREKTEEKDYDMGVLESKTLLSPCGQNPAKGSQHDGSNSSGNTLLTKSDGTAVERNNKREGNEHTNYELENSVHTTVLSSSLQALENGSSPKDATQMNCKGNQLAK
eukprot:15023862-Ditylum_brightwellii.AAC.1